MSFEQAVEAFKRKKNAKHLADEKTDAYKKMLKDYVGLRYGRNKAGERVERPITQERIERREESKNRVIPDLTDELLDFVKGAK